MLIYEGMTIAAAYIYMYIYIHVYINYMKTMSFWSNSLVYYIHEKYFRDIIISKQKASQFKKFWTTNF